MDAEQLFSILIVDDDNSDLNALINILIPQYTVYVAKSGETALRRAKENLPDIILLDVVMGDMSGFEVLGELQKSDITRDIPVIFITGLKGVSDEETGFRLGAVDYITKPFHSSIVKARIESHLKRTNLLRDIKYPAIMLKTRQEVRNIRLRELLYVSVSGHWLKFYLRNGETVEVYASLKDYEEELLDTTGFAHCHKSFIVNLDFVKAVMVKEVLMMNGITLPISKRYSDFKKRYVEWVNG